MTSMTSQTHSTFASGSNTMTKSSIAYFPTAYPDELLYSRFARYQDNMGYPSDQPLLKELFGTQAIAIFDFPSHLDYFISILPSGHHYTVDRLINEGTLLPLYAPFSSPEKIALARKDMAGNNGSKIYGRLGILVSSTQNKLRFCPLCVEDDRKAFGETYWHRLHQANGVKVCSVHKVFLEESTTNPKHLSRRYFFFSAEKEIQMVSERPIDPSDFYHMDLLGIAEDIAWLLNQHNLNPGFDYLSKAYRKLLAEQDFTITSGNRIISMDKFISEFREFYGSELLSSIGCEIDEDISENWLIRLINIGSKRKSMNPLYHLLLIRFLGLSPKQFFNLSEESPFGKGPWPCLNPVCELFKKKVINEYQLLRYKDGRPRPKPAGVFECSCGFSYYRVGPDQNSGDKFTLTKIVKYGGQWEKRLTQLWNNSNISYAKISAVLHVTPHKLEQQAFALGLPFPRTDPNGKVKHLKESVKDFHNKVKLSTLSIDSCRQELLAILEKYPNSDRNFFKKNHRRIYDFLYGYDQEWLNNVIPSGRSNTRVSQGSKRVDWALIDRQISEEVKDSDQRLRNSSGFPQHVTKCFIARDINRVGQITKNLSKLPLTSKALDEVVETHIEYAIRRVQWTENFFREEGISPLRTDFLKKASINYVSDVCRSEKVQRAVDLALSNLSE